VIVESEVREARTEARVFWGYLWWVVVDQSVARMSEHMVVQNSQYWNSWRASKVYTLQINIYNGEIECDPTSAVNPAQINPYIVGFLSQDRSSSKRKTSVIKKTLQPAWNECLIFLGLDIHDKLSLELKTTVFLGPMNPVLGCYNFTLEELLLLSPEELECKTFTFMSVAQGIAANVTLGFVLDAPVSGLQISSKGEDFRASSVFDDAVTGETPVFLNTYGAFASFLFYANSKPLEEEAGQVVPYDTKIKSSTPNVVIL
jgi:hypothetical protein